MAELSGIIVTPGLQVHDQVQETFPVLSQRGRGKELAQVVVDQGVDQRISSLFRGSVFFPFNWLTVDNRGENLYKGKEHIAGRNGIWKDYNWLCVHMNTLREKISFVLTALAYVIFHLGWSRDTGSIVQGTIVSLLNTLPFEIGFTWVLVVFIRYLSDGQRPPWDRILRIFFTIGILFGLFYNLYVRGAQEQERLKQLKPATESLLYQRDTQKVRWYLA